MESKQKYINRFNENMKEIEFAELKVIVDNVFGEDIGIKKRTRNLVDARKIFSKILYDRGYSYTSIGLFLNKDHASIMYYVGDIDFLLKQDYKLLTKYTICKDSFFLGRGDLKPLSHKDVSLIIFELQNENQNLLLERNFILNLKKKYERLEKIINLIDERIEQGDEDRFKKKLNGLLNNY